MIGRIIFFTILALAIILVCFPEITTIISQRIKEKSLQREALNQLAILRGLV